jgi:hypothetical protein
MFSKELEDLIKASLEDGILEDYEKAALMKRAQAEGVDLAELEIYINSIMQKRKREYAQSKDAEQALIDQKKKEAFGRVCPNCGKQLPPMTLKCDCGYEVTSKNKSSSVQILYDKIEKILSAPFKSELDSNERDSEQKERDNQVLELINMFPVPNTKEDIIEFLALAAPNSQEKGGIFGTIPKRMLVLGVILIIASIIGYFVSGGKGVAPLFIIFYGGLFGGAIIMFVDKDTLKWNKKAQVWRSKFEQVLLKGRSLRGDSEFTQQLDYYERHIIKK